MKLIVQCACPLTVRQATQPSIYEGECLSDASEGARNETLMAHHHCRSAGTVPRPFLMGGGARRFRG